MTDKCCGEGTIQAFLDGELESDKLEAVARHTASCEACAFLLHEAEEESSFAFSALGEEFNSLVPTERIRTNLYKEIAQIEKPRESFWTKIFGAGFSFSNPSILAFASLLLVAGLFTTLYIYRENQNEDSFTVAQNNQPKTSPPVMAVNPRIIVPVDSSDGESKTIQPNEEAETENARSPYSKKEIINSPVFERASYRATKTYSKKVETQNPIAPSKDSEQIANNDLIGEESYVKTIATLTDSVNSRKDSSLRPSERVAFEKDLAVVNDAISKMQREIKRNPRNEAAKQVLRSSYQNKIDLLNSVAEKTELMASLK